MKASTLKFLLVGLLATGLFAPGCDQVKKLTGGEQAQPEETTVTEETKPEETPPTEQPPTEEPPAAVADAGADTKTPDAGQPAAAADAGGDTAAAPIEVDEAKFINAFYETTCVQAQIADVEKQKEIKAKILERYEFSEESYDQARGQLEEKEGTKLALKARMEKCNKKAAEGFLKAGSAEVEATKPVAKAPDFLGSRTQAINSGGISGKLNINFTKKMTVNGNFSGKKEGVFFNIPLQGAVDKDGSFKGLGRQGANQIRFNGKASKNGAVGVIEATINKQSTKINISAK